MKCIRVASALACAALGLAAVEARANLVITPSPGFSIGWNGNEGDFFSATNPAMVPVNVARADQGAVAFADNNSSLGAEAALAIHFIPDLNDGIYGNSDSWISNTAAPHFAGIRFNGAQNVASIAFGRDNGRDEASGDCCGGQLSDRWQGTYTLQYTTAANPNETTPDASWTTIGTLNYVSADDTAIGGGFTPWFRHRYEVAENGAPIAGATGIRILVPGGGFDGTSGTDIDEIEVFVPEPASIGLLALGGLGLLGRRRRR